jgi:hypothetical protein
MHIINNNYKTTIDGIEIDFIGNWYYDKISGELSPAKGERVLKYSGGTRKGKFEGNGILEFENGYKFDGLFIKGVFKSGTITDPFGNTLRGKFIRAEYPYGLMRVNDTYNEYFFFFEIPLRKFKFKIKNRGYTKLKND